MKRVYLAIAILIVIPLIVFGTHFYLKHITDNMIGTLLQADKYARQDNTSQAEKELDQFKTTWDKNNFIIATFIRHSELDIVNLSAAKLEPLLADSDKSEYYAESSSLEMQLKHIWETERFTVDNIF
jgi:hypothetical protein